MIEDLFNSLPFKIENYYELTIKKGNNVVYAFYEKIDEHWNSDKKWIHLVQSTNLKEALKELQKELKEKS